MKELDQKITQIRNKSDFLRNQSISAENRDRVGSLLYPDWRKFDAVRKSDINLTVPAIPMKNEIRFRNEIQRFETTLIRHYELQSISYDNQNRHYAVAKTLLLSTCK